MELRMSASDRIRLDALARVKRGELTVVRAAALMGLSVRQARRERRASVGSMVQMGGSHHDWFEGRGPRCVLMVMIDDATNRTYARFYPAETTGAAFDVFGRRAARHGLPRSPYVDRHSIFRDA